jgi:hypothetical protein
MSSERKLFMCGTSGVDNPGAWTKLWTEAEARDYVSESLKKAGWTGKPLKTFTIERHPGEYEDSRIYIWGEDEPGFVDLQQGFHKGVKVEVDGVVVYNDLEPSELSDREDHDDPECDCKQHVKPARAKKPAKARKGKSKR